MPSGNKPLPEPMLTQIYVDIMMSLGHIELKTATHVYEGNSISKCLQWGVQLWMMHEWIVIWMGRVIMVTTLIDKWITRDGCHKGVTFAVEIV